jgi:hypothetical protein
VLLGSGFIGYSLVRRLTRFSEPRVTKGDAARLGRS